MTDASLLPSPAGVTGFILAGGAGRRMGGEDKGLLPFRGRPMVAAVIERLRPQVDDLVVNANRNLDRYAGFGIPVVSDDLPGFAGPLAGIERGLARASQPLLAVVPCDAPLLPPDLVARLNAALRARDAQVAVARVLGRTHPVFSLMRRDLHGDLVAFLRGGGRKVDAWYANLAGVLVDFDDEAEAFSNINTAADLARHDDSRPDAAGAVHPDGRNKQA